MRSLSAFSLDPAAVAFIVHEACLAELRAFKPGNVSFASAGHGMGARDFVASADAMAGVLTAPAACVGERILRAVKATRSVVPFNTNLGIILLCAPLAQAALLDLADRSLRLRLRRVLDALDVRDAELAYQAIRLAEPGGLGRVENHDISGQPRITLLEAMWEARQRDRIAAQYATCYFDVIETGFPIARRAMQRHGREEWVAVEVYLAYLARFADSHVARKHGDEAASAVSREAVELERCLAAADDPAQVLPQLRDFDRRLKSRSINPGTSADLTVATLVAIMLDDSLEKASRAVAREVLASEPART
jgi:triphosphoribosyl-dephospho-CoA synthase